ncbi:MAG TPA: TIM-barrel domain-containing protein [Acidobacteriaceae bacterium]|nr:TIM-barrel domain-containing protein [Acidobacteriaceae bacterium]
MTVRLTRRSVLGGLGAGLAETLFVKRLDAAALFAQAAKPGKLDLKLTSVTPHVLQIAIAPANATPPARELGTIEHPHEAELGKGSSISLISWGKYRIRVEEDPLRITVMDEAQQVRQEIQFDTDSTTIRFRLGSQPLFGMGEGLTGLDRRGTRDGMRNGEGSRGLRTAGARLPIPWLISPEGWGIFVGQPFGSFDLTKDMGIVRSSFATSTRNVYLIVGDTPAELLQGYADLTGYPHLPPLWALGYMQSHRTLASRDEVLGIAKTFREKKLPCDALIYLGTGFCPSGWNTGHGSFTFNSDVFPDPREMFRQFHEEHLKVVLHVVPPYDFHGKLTDTGAAARTLGDAVPYWAEHMPVEEIGVDGWWPDEGDGLPITSRFERNELYWDGQIQAHPERRPFALHRNGYAGLQRFGWLWSGDIDSSWDALAAQVINGINVGLCGIPYWGTDTGGFVPTRELTPELYVRWFQFSAFCPLFRSHGRAWKLRLPWGWNMGTPGPLEGAERLRDWPKPEDLHDAKVEPICRKYLELRYQMLPYIYSTVEQAHRTGLPLMRSLWVAWPNDPKAVSTGDEYMWGDHFLVAPVLEGGATSRKTYLPAGAWWDFWNNQRIEGGAEITREVDLETIPLYARAGAIVPMGPIRQYAAEPSDEPVVLRVYPGANGRFSWYEDDGSSFRYRQGESTRIECAWDDAARKLTLTVKRGKKPWSERKVSIQSMDQGVKKLVTLTSRVTAVKL